MTTQTQPILPHYDLSPFASKDKERPAIQAVHFGPNRIEATDGSVLAYVARPSAEVLPDIALDAADFHKACQSGALAMVPTATGVAVTDKKGETRGVRVSDASFPNTRDIIREDGTDYREFTVCASTLRAVAEYAMKHARKNEFGKSPVTFRVPREDSGGTPSFLHFSSTLSAGDCVRGVIAACRRID